MIGGEMIHTSESDPRHCWLCDKNPANRSVHFSCPACTEMGPYQEPGPDPFDTGDAVPPPQRASYCDCGRVMCVTRGRIHCGYCEGEAGCA